MLLQALITLAPEEEDDESDGSLLEGSGSTQVDGPPGRVPAAVGLRAAFSGRTDEQTPVKKV